MNEELNMNNQKLLWKKAHGTYNLLLVNPGNLDVEKCKNLMDKIALPTPDFNKSFSGRCQKLFYRWLDNPCAPFPEAVYCLLSNWPYSGFKAARESSRSSHILELWNELSFVLPERRLTDWKISEEKVVPEVFELWWQKQQKA